LTTFRFSFIFYLSFLNVLNNLPLNFWEIYEINFPEVPNSKAPGGLKKIPWSLVSMPLLSMGP